MLNNDQRQANMGGPGAPGGTGGSTNIGGVVIDQAEL